MLVLFLLIATIFSLVILYHYLPNRKIFIYFCLSLIFVFTIAGLIARSQKPQEELNLEQRTLIIKQQNIFIDWYKDYQKDIDQLDRIWQSYYSIINDLDIDSLNEQLTSLENDARIEQVHLYAMKVPDDLDEECRLLTYELLRKTQKYSDEQVQTILKTKELSADEKFLLMNTSEQVKQLQEVIIRNAPIGLFTANELTLILKYFKLPEENNL